MLGWYVGWWGFNGKKSYQCERFVQKIYECHSRANTHFLPVSVLSSFSYHLVYINVTFTSFKKNFSGKSFWGFIDVSLSDLFNKYICVILGLKRTMKFLKQYIYYGDDIHSNTTSLCCLCVQNYVHWFCILKITCKQV